MGLGITRVLERVTRSRATRARSAIEGVEKLPPISSWWTATLAKKDVREVGEAAIETLWPIDLPRHHAGIYYSESHSTLPPEDFEMMSVRFGRVLFHTRRWLHNAQAEVCHIVSIFSTTLRIRPLAGAPTFAARPDQFHNSRVQPAWRWNMWRTDPVQYIFAGLRQHSAALEQRTTHS